MDTSMSAAKDASAACYQDAGTMRGNSDNATAAILAGNAVSSVAHALKAGGNYLGARWAYAAAGIAYSGAGNACRLAAAYGDDGEQKEYLAAAALLHTYAAHAYEAAAEDGGAQ